MKKSNWEGKNGPLLIAEVGGNHEGDFEYAKKLTELAIESGADFVKFQLYSGDTLVSRIESPQRNKHFQKFELGRDKYIELAEMCKANKVGFMASVWDPDYVSWIDDYMPIYKIGSGDLTAYPLLRKFANLRKPIILSTGLANTQDVKGAVEFIQQENEIYKSPEYLSLLQCTSMYPIPFEDANLEVMKSFSETFGLPVGYSDHTEGYFALLVAVAMGAQILEFHFTDTRENKEFRDHKVSLTKDEVKDLIEQIKDIAKLKGSPEKRPLEIEGDHPTTFRRAVYPKKDLKKGTVIKEEDITVLRPNHGIDAREYYNLIGKKLVRDVLEHQKLSWDLFEDQ
ncbi:N-acetylneuraminate synthase family protein [Flagellimonas oceanensis]|uniref:N-acetylneuraminate synthase family protein n=1 Tax=Flagellimonas oceanensis TaxID=2499163 RepID=UPI000F8DC963|nr:N-acetylneuraminate synthase family protein [Allomuricauda oceanensis]